MVSCEDKAAIAKTKSTVHRIVVCILVGGEVLKTSDKPAKAAELPPPLFSTFEE
jgi:hypothetical protein